jgi:acyl-CoA synthetase (NDP forming)
MIDEVTRGGGDRAVHLVNPRYDEIGGRACLPSLKHLDGPVDLALLGVGDDALEAQLRDAAEMGVRSAVIFASAHGSALRASLREIATHAGMALCGAGCMGFVNLDDGLRATGYIEREVLPRGPIALVTHSGSIFSALLRTRRALGYTLAVSSGQELVTTTADYLDYVLEHTDTRVLALVLEAARDGARLVSAVHRAAAANVPTVVLPVGSSPLGASLVTAHSGALAGAHATWDALAEGTGAIVVRDLAEFTDTLELLAIGRRPRRGAGIATVHDSGAERTMVADRAHELGVPFAPLGAGTLQRIDELLDEGLDAANPLDLWGRGADTRTLFANSLQAMADDPAVSLVALAVDLVEEYDGDRSYIEAPLDVDTDAPLVVLANLASAIDHEAASTLRANGVPVLEGTSSGLAAIGHVVRLALGPTPFAPAVDVERQARWRTRLANDQPLRPDEPFALLADYGIPIAAMRQVDSAGAAVAAACEIGYPVVMKTAAALAHKSDVGGVVLGIGDDDQVHASYALLADAHGGAVTVHATAPTGIEVIVGVTRDVYLGPLVVVGAGGVLAELVRDTAVLLPPFGAERAHDALQRLTISELLAGWRGAPPADLARLVDVIVGVGVLAYEIGDQLAALDVNPVVAGTRGAVAVDVFVERTARVRTD